VQQRQVPRLAHCPPCAVAEGGAGRLADRGGQEAGHHVHRRCLYGEQLIHISYVYQHVSMSCRWCQHREKIIEFIDIRHYSSQPEIGMLCTLGTKMCPCLSTMPT
jgi:hypothetical protein